MPLLKSTLIASAVDSTEPGGFTFVFSSLVTPARSSWNMRDEEVGQLGRRLDADLVVAAQLGLALLHDPDLLLQILDHRDGDEVEAALERGAHLVDAAVARVGRGDEVEAALRADHLAELGHGDLLLGQDGDERVLDLRRRCG